MSTTGHGTIERSSDGGIVRFDRTLPYPVEEVWSALTDPHRLADWWPPMAGQITVDLREGGAMVFAWPDTDFPTLEFAITKLVPYALLEHTHTSPGSWMRYELTPTAEGTRLLATYFVPDIDMAMERGDVVGLHYSLDRLEPALGGTPTHWDNDVFATIHAAYRGGPAVE